MLLPLKRWSQFVWNPKIIIIAMLTFRFRPVWITLDSLFFLFSFFFFVFISFSGRSFLFEHLFCNRLSVLSVNYLSTKIFTFSVNVKCVYYTTKYRTGHRAQGTRHFSILLLLLVCAIYSVQFSFHFDYLTVEYWITGNCEMLRSSDLHANQFSTICWCVSNA